MGGTVMVDGYLHATDWFPIVLEYAPVNIGLVASISFGNFTDVSVGAARHRDDRCYVMVRNGGGSRLRWP